MSTIKKGFVELHEILVNNKDKKIKDLMDQLLPIMESQQRDKNHFEDEHGLWVFCYYHKEWELAEFPDGSQGQVEYGRKVNTATGLNTMCKVGTNQWTKQQRDYKASKANLLNQVADGSIQVSELDDYIQALEDERKRIVPLLESHHEEALQINADLEDTKS